MRTFYLAILVAAAFGAVRYCDGSIITPDTSLNVSADGDRDWRGTVSISGIDPGTYYIRERGVSDTDPNSEKMRVASFMAFDLNSLSAADVANPGFTATFAIDFTARLNTTNGLAATVGRVEDDGVAGDSWNTSGAAGTVPLFEWGNSSADQQVVVANVLSDSFGTYTIVVTSIVRDWVNGTHANNGLVLFGGSRSFQGAGFQNAQLTVAVPEPSTLLLTIMGLLGLAVPRLRRRGV